MCDEHDYVHSGRGFIAQSISQTKVRHLAKDKQKLNDAEEFLMQVLTDRYSVAELDPAVLKICSSLLVRVGESLHKSCRLHGDEKGSGALAKAEAKFLKDLEKSGVANVGAPVLPETVEVMAATAAKASKKLDDAKAVSQLRPDEKPTLKFDNSGSLVHDAEYLAAAGSITTGTRVDVTRQVRKANAGDRGVVQHFTQSNAMVLLDRENISVALPVNALCAEAPMAKEAETAPIAEKEDASVVRESQQAIQGMEGFDWKLLGAEEANSMLINVTRTALFQLLSACAADRTKIVVSEAGVFRAKRQLGAREVTLVPYTEDIRTEDQLGGLPPEAFVVAHVSTPGSADCLLYLARPEEVPAKAEADVCDSEQTEKHFLKVQRPFWTVRDVTPSVSKPNLEEYHISIACNPSFKIEGELYKAVSKRCPMTVRVSVLSNPATLRRGDVLFFKTPALRITRKRKVGEYMASTSSMDDGIVL
jgi:hypothetical protein